MARVLIVSSHGSDDPTRATIPFVAASGALEAGHQPEVALMGEATYLLKSYVAEQVHGVGWPPLQELWGKLTAQGVKVHV